MKDTTLELAPYPTSTTGDGMARPQGRRTYTMAGVDRTVAVLNAVAGAATGVTLAEVARRAGLGEATALRYLSSLASHDLVMRDESGRYSIGLNLFLLGQQAGGIRDVRKLAFRHMEKLLEEFEETVNVAQARNDALVIIDVLESTRAIRKGASVGEVDVWHVSALGKAILSALPEEQAVAVLDSYERQRYTEHTKTDLDTLLADLEATRTRGYAIDDEEFEEGLRCVGVAVLDGRGRPAYALSISGFAPRLTPEVVERMGEAVANAATGVSHDLGFIPTNPEGAG